MESYFPGMSESNLDKMIKFEAHRHRIDMAGGFDVNGSAFNPDKMNIL